MEFLKRIFDGSLMPHGHCLLWRHDLLFLNLFGDGLTFLAYSIIPMALVYLVRKRDDLVFNWIFVLFAAFIFFCVLTHAIGILNIWHGYYFIEGTTKLTTGIVSIITAIMLWKLMPQALSIPSNAMLQERNEELMQARAELLESNRLLEQRVMERTRELELLATQDPLTDLNNRREIMRLANIELLRSQRYSSSFSVLMIDIDLFKAINDMHGHPFGDSVLFNAADAMKKTSRVTDMIGRYGGEEFLILCPNTDTNEAEDLAERIRIAVESLELDHSTRITCSIGIAAYNNEQSVEDVIAKADEALYIAKNNGRNCVQVAGQ